MELFLLQKHKVRYNVLLLIDLEMKGGQMVKWRDLVIGAAGEEGAILVNLHHAHPLSVTSERLHTVSVRTHTASISYQDSKVKIVRMARSVVAEACCS